VGNFINLLLSRLKLQLYLANQTGKTLAFAMEVTSHKLKFLINIKHTFPSTRVHIKEFIPNKQPKAVWVITPTD
jgi:hypothetical protein